MRIFIYSYYGRCMEQSATTSTDREDSDQRLLGFGVVWVDHPQTTRVMFSYVYEYCVGAFSAHVCCYSSVNDKEKQSTTMWRHWTIDCWCFVEEAMSKGSDRA